MLLLNVNCLWESVPEFYRLSACSLWKNTFSSPKWMMMMPLPDVFVRECVRSHVCVKVCALARVCVTTQRASNLEQHPPAISLQISTPCFLMCLFLYIDGDRLGSVLLMCVDWDGGLLIGVLIAMQRGTWRWCRSRTISLSRRASKTSWRVSRRSCTLTTTRLVGVQALKPTKKMFAWLLCGSRHGQGDGGQNVKPHCYQLVTRGLPVILQ